MSTLRVVVEETVREIATVKRLAVPVNGVGEPRTTLTEFFKSNAVDNTAKQYFYHELYGFKVLKNGVIVNAVKAAHIEVKAGCTQFIRTRKTFTTCA